MSEACWYRRFRSFARGLSIIRSSSKGSPRLSRAGATGVSSRMALKISNLNFHPEMAVSRSPSHRAQLQTKTSRFVRPIPWHEPVRETCRQLCLSQYRGWSGALPVRPTRRSGHLSEIACERSLQKGKTAATPSWAIGSSTCRRITPHRRLYRGRSASSSNTAG